MQPWMETKETPVRRLERGLKPHVRDIVTALEFGTHQEVLRRAQLVSYHKTRTRRDFQQDQTESSKRKWNESDEKSGKWVHKKGQIVVSFTVENV